MMEVFTSGVVNAGSPLSSVGRKVLGLIGSSGAAAGSSGSASMQCRASGGVAAATSPLSLEPEGVARALLPALSAPPGCIKLGTAVLASAAPCNASMHILSLSRVRKSLKRNC